MTSEKALWAPFSSGSDLRPLLSLTFQPKSLQQSTNWINPPLPQHTTMPFETDESLAWQKPDWTKNTKLKPTGKSAAGNLAKPITNLPHQKDQGPGFSKPEWTDEVGESGLGDKSLAKPITTLPHGAAADKSLEFAKPEWTKDAGLATTGKADKLKSGGDIARPIGGIRPVED